jgi:uncharacterized membrane protein YhaH (DUF805 family)
LEFIGYKMIVQGATEYYFQTVAGWITFQPTPFNIFLWAMMVIGQWPAICIGAKRWHDRNRTGWLAGGIAIVAMAGSVTQVYYGPTGTHLNWPIYVVTLLLSGALGVWQFVECGCLDGTKGPNKYGPSPKGIGGAAEVF